MRYVVVGNRSSRGARSVARARTAGAVVRRGAGHGDGVTVGHGLRVAAAYAWRLLVLGAAVYVVFAFLGRLQLVAVALFLALVVTAVLRPLADLLARHMPRTVAVIVSIIGSLLLVLGVMALVGSQVAGESGRLGHEFAGGLGRIERWLEGSPFHVSHAVLSDLQGKVATFVSEHRSVLISSALSGAGRAVEFITGLVLALFCSLFFIRSGDRFWRWFKALMPGVRETRWTGRDGRPGVPSPGTRAASSSWRPPTPCSWESPCTCWASPRTAADAAGVLRGVHPSGGLARRAWRGHRRRPGHPRARRRDRGAGPDRRHRPVGGSRTAPARPELGGPAAPRGRGPLRHRGQHPGRRGRRRRGRAAGLGRLVRDLRTARTPEPEPAGRSPGHPSAPPGPSSRPTGPSRATGPAR